MISARRETAFLLVGDVLLLGLSLWLALAVRHLAPPSQAYVMDHVTPFVPVFLISLLVFFIAGLYERQTRLVKRVLGSRIIGAQTANTLIAAVVFFALPLTIAPKTILALYLVISVALISAWRFFIVPRLSIAERQRVAVVGRGSLVEQTCAELRNQPKYYLDLKEHLDPSALPVGSLAARLRAAAAAGTDLMIIDTRDDLVRAELPDLYDVMVSGAMFVEFSVFYEHLFDRVPLENIDHAWLLECLPRKNLAYTIAKRAIDIVGALVGLVLAAPFIVLAVLALMAGGGTPFIRHDRVGRGGRPFKMIKLRSMLINDHGDSELQKQNRVTPLGTFLRRTRIDELPQLWNVLRGDLSFIGPRPELPAIARVYEHEIPYYAARYLLAPGLSGWAQLYDGDPPRGSADIERTKRKLSYDLYYLKHRSLALDLAVALKTLRTLASFSGT